MNYLIIYIYSFLKHVITRNSDVTVRNSNTSSLQLMMSSYWPENLKHVITSSVHACAKNWTWRWMFIAWDKILWIFMSWNKRITLHTIFCLLCPKYYNSTAFISPSLWPLNQSDYPPCDLSCSVQGQVPSSRTSFWTPPNLNLERRTPPTSGLAVSYAQNIIVFILVHDAN